MGEKYSQTSPSVVGGYDSVARYVCTSTDIRRPAGYVWVSAVLYVCERQVYRREEGHVQDRVCLAGGRCYIKVDDNNRRDRRASLPAGVQRGLRVRLKETKHKPKHALEFSLLLFSPSLRDRKLCALSTFTRQPTHSPRRRPSVDESKPLEACLGNSWRTPLSI